VDTTNHNVLDGVFANDFNGVANTTVTNADSLIGTTDTYRYATLNGVKVALPTYGDALVTMGYRSGTAIGNTTPTLGDSSVNAIYNDLLAIWDGYNGTGTNGTPPDWRSSDYWSATPSTNGHAFVYLYGGYVYDNSDTGLNYVALQVL